MFEFSDQLRFVQISPFGKLSLGTSDNWVKIMMGGFKYHTFIGLVQFQKVQITDSKNQAIEFGHQIFGFGPSLSPVKKSEFVTQTGFNLSTELTQIRIFAIAILDTA